MTTTRPRSAYRRGALRTAGALTAAVVGVLITAACSSSPAPGNVATAVTAGTYVALGDSYTAGPDIPAQTSQPAGCDRSSSNYPSLVARSLGFSADHFHDVSCSGATVADLTAAQTTGNGTNPAQLSALNSTTSLVTLGIGGNDVGFSSVLTRCVELDLVPSLIGHSASGSSPCEAYYSSAGTESIDQRISTMGTRLTGAIDAVKRDAPNARVLVIGYPDLLPADGSACANTLGITTADIAFLHHEEIRLNATLKQNAEAAGAGYVDTYTPSLGHDACSAANIRWIEPLNPSAAAAPMHPNAVGEQSMATAVLSTLS
jgi:lysophospholipase L1-like esterase